MDVAVVIDEVKRRISGRLPRDVIFDEIVEENKQDIIDAIVEKVSFAMEQAILGAQSILKSQSDDYINGLRLSGDLTIEIDESVKYLEEGYDRHPMLENFLTGPKSKIAKDGSVYSVIPIGKREGDNTEKAMGNQVKSVLTRGVGKGASIGKLQDIVERMTNTINGTVNTQSKEPTGFAVASSKQDSSSSWVHPGFEGVNQLYYINTLLKQEMIEVVSVIIEEAVNNRG